MEKKFAKPKQLLLILLILLLLFGTVGCFRPSSKEDQAVAYMNEKYDDEFSFKYYGGSIIFLQSKKFPEANVQVRGNKLDDGTYEFWDNYVYCKYEKETRDFLKKVFEEVFQCEIKINYMLGLGTNFSKKLNNNTTFEQFINNESVGVEILLPPGFDSIDRIEIENMVKSTISDNNLILSANIFLSKNQYQFEQGFNIEFSELNQLKELLINMKEHNEFVVFRWRNI